MVSSNYSHKNYSQIVLRKNVIYHFPFNKPYIDNKHYSSIAFVVKYR